MTRKKLSRDLISIVMITFNHEVYITQAIKSVLSQKTEKFDVELIIADDASTDATAEVIETFRKKYPKIIKPILHKNNIGIQDNFLGALNAAKGKYIALCEGDDYWTDSSKLDRQYRYMESHSNDYLVFHPVEVKDELSNKIIGCYPDDQISKTYTLEELLDHNFIQTNSVLYRNIGPYKDNNVNNMLPLDWYIHLYHARCGEIGFIDRRMAVYRKHTSSVWWRNSESSGKFWKKNLRPHLNTFRGIELLFKGSDKYQKIINTSKINTLLYIINEVPSSSQKEIIHLLNKSYPDIFIEITLYLYPQVTTLRTEAGRLKTENAELREKTNKMYQDIEYQNNEISQLAEEISQIKNSKMYRYMKKIRSAKHKITMR